jgi:hypothetical protein
MERDAQIRQRMYLETPDGGRTGAIDERAPRAHEIRREIRQVDGPTVDEALQSLDLIPRADAGKREGLGAGGRRVAFTHDAGAQAVHGRQSQAW